MSGLFPFKYSPKYFEGSLRDEFLRDGGGWGGKRRKKKKV